MTESRSPVVQMLPTTATMKRHVVHDPRSLDHPAVGATGPLRPVFWQRHGPTFDQDLLNGGKGLGCCTMCAGFGVLMHDPYSAALHGRTFDLARDVEPGYEEETRLDDREIPGHWPPDDTGSAGIYMAKVLQRHNLATAYRHAFGISQALAALQRGPLCVGTTWLNSMFTPDRSGTMTVDPHSGVAGGHEYVIDQYEPDPKAPGGGWVWKHGSWGDSFGIAGRARMSVAGFDWLLRQQGDVIQLVVPGAPV